MRGQEAMTIISLLKKPFFGRYQKPWRWPPGVDPAGWERIEIESASGARLAALHGASTGGPARGAIDGHPFRAAFLEAPFTTLDEFWRRSSLFAYAVLRAMSALLPTLMEELRPIARIAKLQRLERMLLVYGSEDPFTPPSMGDRLVAACPPSTRTAVWIVPGAKHCQAQRVAGEEDAKRLVAFFDESLGPARGWQRSTA